MAHLAKRASGHLTKNSGGHLTTDCRIKKYYAVFNPGNISNWHPLCETVGMPTCHWTYDVDSLPSYIRDYIVGGPYDTEAECQVERLEIFGSSPPATITATVSGAENDPDPGEPEVYRTFSNINGGYNLPWFGLGGNGDCCWQCSAVRGAVLAYHTSTPSGHSGYWALGIYYYGLACAFQKPGSFFNGGHVGAYALTGLWAPQNCGTPVAVVS